MTDQRVRGRSSGRRRQLVIGVVAIAFAVFVFTHGPELATAWTTLRHLRPAPLLLAIGLSVIAVLNRAGLFRSAHRAVGLDADLGAMTTVSASAYALNKVVKTGGVGGIAVYVRHGRSRSQPAGQVVAACVLASLAGHLALVTIIVAAVGSGVLLGPLSAPWALSAAALAVGLSVALGGLARLTRDRRTMHRLWQRPHRLWSRYRARRGLPPSSATNTEHVDRFYDAADAVRTNPRAALPVVGHAIAAKLLGAAVLATSLEATQAGVGLSVALSVYALALLTGALGVVPGGLGAVEASTTALLVTQAVPVGIAIAAVLTFRLFDFWLPVVVGLVASQRLRPGSRPTGTPEQPPVARLDPVIA